MMGTMSSTFPIRWPASVCLTILPSMASVRSSGVHLARGLARLNVCVLERIQDSQVSIHGSRVHSINRDAVILSCFIVK